MPSDDNQSRPRTGDTREEDRVARPAKPDQRHNRPAPAEPAEGLRVLYG
ncbi:hypothetical protein [Oceanibium sediminis]|nr:hypothetical protein [Oceanibium sediminis]